MRARGTALVVLAVLGAWSAGFNEAAARSRERDYAGGVAGGGTISFGLSTDGRRVFGIRVAGVPGNCQGEPAYLGWSLGPAKISFHRTFRLSLLNDVAPSVRGTFLSGGRARGRTSYFDRGDCRASSSWSARRHARPIGKGRVLALAGYGPGRHVPEPTTAGSAPLNPGGMAALPDGSLLIADGGGDSASESNAVRRLLPNGRLVTAAGTGQPGASGDGGPARAARLQGPQDVAVQADGTYLIADTLNNCIRLVRGDGLISTVAGHCGSAPGFGGDGGAAVAASFDYPTGVAARPGGGFFVADLGNSRVREVLPDGRIRTAAGDGTPGLGGDGGPATGARLDRPSAVAVRAGGDLLIADEDNNRIRQVGADGSIHTVAGSGLGGLAAAGFSGDGGPAKAARLNEPSGLAATPDGGFLIADSGNGRIRKVGPTGAIATFAGGGELVGGVRPGSSDLARPRHVALTRDGVTLADAGGARLAFTTTHRLLLEARRRTDGLGSQGDLRASHRHRPSVRVATSLGCRLTLVVTRAGHTAARVRRTLRSGSRVVRLPHRLRRGRYRLTLSSRRGGRVATSISYLSVR